MPRIKKIKKIPTKVKEIKKQIHKKESNLEDQVANEEVEQFVSFVRKSQNANDPSLEQSEIPRTNQRNPIQTNRNPSDSDEVRAYEGTQGQSSSNQIYSPSRRSQSQTIQPARAPILRQNNPIIDRRPAIGPENEFRDRQNSQNSQTDERKYDPEAGQEFAKKRRKDWSR